MEDFATFFFLVTLALGVYVFVVNKRGRRDKEALSEQIAGLAARLYSLEEQAKRAATKPAEKPAVTAPAPQPVGVLERPAVERPAPAPPPPMTPAARPEIAPTPRPISPASVTPVPPPAPRPVPVTPPKPPAPATPRPSSTVPPAASAAERAPQSPSMSAPPRAPSAPVTPPRFAAVQPPKPKVSLEKLVSIWAPKVAVVLVVVGLGWLLQLGWKYLAPWMQVLMLYAGGIGLLVLGIFLEKKDAYKLLGRTLVGGAWAVIFLLTYGIGHVSSILVLHSETIDLFLMIAVAAAMVWHTLKYKSQLVTGCAFLLGFASVVASVGAANPDPSHLIAGAILVAGLLVVVHRYQWYQLELCGILASYLSHLYWLYKVLGFPPARLAFQHHEASIALVVAYWVVFRASYVWRKISSREQESISTASALLNPVLFLAVMKYQSLHPEWAWWALLTMGAIEFTLGQLPASRRREAPFKVLSSLGAALMVAALPFKWSGDALEMLWLAGAEAFLLSGIFTRERLFRGFGLIISFLIALYALPFRVAPWAEKVLDGQPHYDARLAVVLGALALVLYANSHILGRRWRELFAVGLEQFSLFVLSFMASLFGVCAIFACVADNAAATALAVMVLALSWLGRRFSIPEFTYQAHWISAVAFIQVIIVGEPLKAAWMGLPQRVWMFSAVAGLLYLSSRFVRLSETGGAKVFASVYTWGATILLAVLIYFQAPVWAVIVFWICLGLALCAASEFFHRNDLKWQAYALVLASCVRALIVNFYLTNTVTSRHISYRLISVSLAAAGIYLLAKWAPVKAIRPVYTVIGTLLLTLLAYDETPAPWVPVAWISLATLLALAGRWWKDRPLLWQTHALGALAVAWTLWGSFTPHYRTTSVQLISVAITGTLLYILTWITNVAEMMESERISHAYSWAASLLVSWLLWAQLEEVNVALAWGVFGLLLFELPGLLEMAGIRNWGSPGSWRAQGYVALVSSFVRIFFVNLNTPATADFFKVLVDQGVLTILPLTAIYFWIYSRLYAINHGTQPGRSAAGGVTGMVEYLLACLGTATVAAIFWFAAPADAVVVGLAALFVALLAVAWQIRHQIFLYQALIMLGITAFRLSMRNFYLLKDPVYSSLSYSIWTLVLLAAGLPLAFLIRNNQKTQKPGRGGWWDDLVSRPEQPVFFVTLVLTAALLYLRMSGGAVTLAWAAEGVLAFSLALWVKERSFRLAGLSLVLFCVVKIPWDTWNFHDVRRPLSWIGVGAILFVVTFLYGKNREALKDYL